MDEKESQKQPPRLCRFVAGLRRSVMYLSLGMRSFLMEILYPYWVVRLVFTGLVGLLIGTWFVFGSWFADPITTFVIHTYLAIVAIGQWLPMRFLVAVAGKSNLKGADLRRASLINARLSDANLAGAGLGHVDLTNAELTNANMTSARLGHADLTDADLTNANLTNADLKDGANLTGANLTNARLGHADLTDADLTNANLTNADLKDGANLTGANLTNASLKMATLRSANLTNAIFAGSDLTNASFMGSDLTNANLADASLTGVHMTRVTFNKTRIDRVDLRKTAIRECGDGGEGGTSPGGGQGAHFGALFYGVRGERAVEDMDTPATAEAETAATYSLSLESLKGCCWDQSDDANKPLLPEGIDPYDLDDILREK